MTDDSNLRAHSTGVYQHVSADALSRRNAQPEPQYDPRSGAHFWIALVTFRVADPDAQDNVLDTENLLWAHLGCYFCEQPYTPRLRHRRCPGEPKD